MRLRNQALSHRKWALLAVLALLVGLAVPAVAESWNRTIEFSAPFAFQVNDTTLPAGRYRVEAADLDSLTRMRVRTEDGQWVATFNTRALPETWDMGNKTGSKPKVVFVKHDGEQTLAEVWLPEQSNGRRVVSDMDLTHGERTELWQGEDYAEEGG